VNVVVVKDTNLLHNIILSKIEIKKMSTWKDKYSFISKLFVNMRIVSIEELLATQGPFIIVDHVRNVFFEKTSLNPRILIGAIADPANTVDSHRILSL
jgi:hypothetical protein